MLPRGAQPPLRPPINHRTGLAPDVPTPSARTMRTTPKELHVGYLIYDGQTAEAQMEDRTLAHLQIVIINKLR